MSKPLHTPEPRHRDRRGAWGTERLWESLARPSAESVSARHRRFDRPRPSTPRWMILGLGVVFAVVAVLMVGEISAASSLVPYDRAPQEYQTLAEMLRRSCAEESCVLGWSRAETVVPPELRGAMARLRVRSLEYDSHTARATFSAERLVTGPRLVYEWPATAGVQRNRSMRDQIPTGYDSRRSDPSANPRDTALRLAEGWYLWVD